MSVSLIDKYMASLGVETYRVGGSVRDEILGKQPKDADYMVRGVSASTLKLLLLNAGANVTNLRLRDGRLGGYRARWSYSAMSEVVLPRNEVSTGPGHRDFEIVMDPELPLSEDAKRRDFTFNALYKAIGHSGDVVTDPTNRGLHDLQRRLIHTTHPDSFRDDPLRILRGLRFAARGFDLSIETKRQMREHHNAVTGLTIDGNVSGTVYEEFDKILAGSDPVTALRAARDTGVLAVVLPELAPMLGFDQGSRYHDLTVDEHTFQAIATAVLASAPQRVRWALLFHDSGKPATAWRGLDDRLHYYSNGDGSEDHEVVGERIWRAAATRLNVPKDLREDAATLIRHHMVPTAGKAKGSKVRRARVKFGDAMLHDLYLHVVCDLNGKNVGSVKNSIEHIGALERLRGDAQAAGVPTDVSGLLVNGKDAMLAGARGKDVGRVLAAVLDDIVVQPDWRRYSRDWQLTALGTHL